MNRSSHWRALDEGMAGGVDSPTSQETEWARSSFFRAFELFLWFAVLVVATILAGRFDVLGAGVVVFGLLVVASFPKTIVDFLTRRFHRTALSSWRTAANELGLLAFADDSNGHPLKMTGEMHGFIIELFAYCQRRPDELIGRWYTRLEAHPIAEPLPYEDGFRPAIGEWSFRHDGVIKDPQTLVSLARELVQEVHLRLRTPAQSQSAPSAPAAPRNLNARQASLRAVIDHGIQSKQDDAVALAVKELSEDNAASVEGPIIRALERGGPRGQESAIAALGKMGTLRAVGPLLDYSQDLEILSPIARRSRRRAAAAAVREIRLRLAATTPGAVSVVPPRGGELSQTPMREPDGALSVVNSARGGAVRS